MAIESNEVWKDRRIEALGREIKRLRKAILNVPGDTGSRVLQAFKDKLATAIEERAKIAYSQYKA